MSRCVAPTRGRNPGAGRAANDDHPLGPAGRGQQCRVDAHRAGAKDHHRGAHSRRRERKAVGGRGPRAGGRNQQRGIVVAAVDASSGVRASSTRWRGVAAVEVRRDRPESDGCHRPSAAVHSAGSCSTAQAWQAPQVTPRSHSHQVASRERASVHIRSGAVALHQHDPRPRARGSWAAGCADHALPTCAHQSRTRRQRSPPPTPGRGPEAGMGIVSRVKGSWKRRRTAARASISDLAMLGSRGARSRGAARRASWGYPTANARGGPLAPVGQPQPRTSRLLGPHWRRRLAGSVASSAPR